MKKFTIICFCIALPFFLKAQIQINGQVTNKNDGSPLPGATVTLKSARIMTATDKDGKFTLPFPRLPDTLQISFVGYSTLVFPLPGAPNKFLRFSLYPDPRALREVVVSTGYQFIPSERATGSFDQISSLLIEREVSTNILTRLDGIAGSVLFDKRGTGTTNFSVRGLSTLTSTIQQPLIVLDNFPYDGDLNNINPNDVESITVLKDAAAASIWGVRAGNGVIVITTKKGRFSQPLKIIVNSNVTVSAKPNLFALPVISSSDFIDVENYLFAKGFFTSALANKRRPVVSPVVELLNAQKSGALSAASATAQINALRNIDVRNDFERYIYRDALSQQHNIQLSGGNNTIASNLSVGYDDNLQSLIGNSYNRFTFRTEHTYRPVKNLQLQAAIQYSESNTITDSQGGYGTITTGGGKTVLYPYAQLADAHGNPLPIAKDYRYNYIDTVGHGILADWTYKPLAEIKQANNNYKLHDLLINTGLQYHFLPSLGAEIRYQYENASGDQDNEYGTGTYFTRNLINRYTQVAGSTIMQKIPYGSIVDETGSMLVSNNVRGQLNYFKEWNNKNRLSIIGGAEISQKSTNTATNRNYGFNDNTLTTSGVDYSTLFPVYGNLGTASQIPYINSFSGLLNRTVSAYTNGSFTYHDRYTVSLSARRDASNLFGVETDRKWVPLWSAGFSWLLSDEQFYHAAWLPYAKLRVTYGYSGNVNNTIPAVTTIQYQTPNNANSITGLPLAFITNFPNPNLTWEKSGMLNLGLDFGLKNSRVTGSVEYYYKNSTNLIGLVPADITAGASGYLSENSAQLKSHGVDITLNSMNLTGAFQWSSALLFSTNFNKVAKYLYNPASYTAYVGNGTLSSPVAGQSAYEIISYKWAGLDPVNGNPRAYLNGKVSEDYTSITSSAGLNDLVFSGPALPQYFGSFRNDFRYRAFMLSVNIGYRFDFYVRRNALSYFALFNNWVGYNDYDQRWQKPGDELKTNVPSIVYPANSSRDMVYDLSSATVLRGDNVRLKDIRLSYRFLKTEHCGLPFKSIDIYAYANNLGIIWRANKLGIDPDFGTGLPAPRTLSLGFKLEL